MGIRWRRMRILVNPSGRLEKPSKHVNTLGMEESRTCLKRFLNTSGFLRRSRTAILRQRQAVSGRIVLSIWEAIRGIKQTSYSGLDSLIKKFSPFHLDGFRVVKLERYTHVTNDVDRSGLVRVNHLLRTQLLHGLRREYVKNWGQTKLQLHIRPE